MNINNICYYYLILFKYLIILLIKKADGAFLIAVESITEHMFLQDYLSKNDVEQRKWYTSGQEINNRWSWTSINSVFSFEQGFLDPLPDDLGTNLVYAYRCK